MKGRLFAVNRRTACWFTRAVRKLPAWLFPARCRLCGDPAQDGLCHPCLEELPWLGRHCRQCAQPLAATGATLHCGRCQQRPPAFDHTRATVLYQAPVDYLIRQLKYGQELGLAPLLAGLFLQHAGPLSPLPDRLVPVPLHPARLRTRGFNQSAELARALGRALGVPVHHLCRRTRNTTPQSRLPPVARRTNLRNAFELAHGSADGRIALVDDVMTSGQTAHELARVLKAGGAQTVEVWVIARSGHP